jgi:ubiquinone/menaquinone biosynthesis C-methylase UbiE
MWMNRSSTRRLYDRLAPFYDSFASYEARAKARALECLDLSPGQQVLNVGLGTGKEHLLIQSAIAPDGIAVGLDLSQGMLRKARQATSAPLCQADGRRLPFAARSCERLFCAYVLDLIPTIEHPGWLGEFRRVLKPGGVMVLLCLTEGVDRPSRALVKVWKAVYELSPLVCGGCRPLQLTGLVEQAGFTQVEREVVVQLSVPSEIVRAT